MRYTPSEVGLGDFLAAGVQDVFVDADLSFEDDGNGNFVDEISIPLDNDGDGEVTGEIEVTINSDSAAPNYTYLVGTTSKAKTKIWDDDAPELMITGGTTITEGAGVQAIFNVIAQVQPSGGSVDVDYTPVSANFLPAGMSGNKVENHTLRFEGDGPYTATLPVNIHNDEIKDTNGRINVTLNQKATISGYTVAGAPRDEAFVTVRDDDSLPTLTIAANETQYAENASKGAVFTITATEVSATTALTVRYTPAEVDSGDFLAAGIQDTYVDAELSFEDDGDGNFVDEITITLDNDSTGETTGEIEVTINSDPAAPINTYKVGSTANRKDENFG